MTFDRLSNDAPVTPSDPAPAASDASDAGNDAIGKTQAEALVGLEPIRMEDAPRITAAAEAAGVVSWSHFFPYLYLSGRQTSSRRILHEFVEDSALVYRIERRNGKERLTLLLTPFPFSPAALQRARERMWLFNGRRGARIIRMQQSEALLVARAGFEIHHHSDEYIYDAEAVLQQQGSSFATLRRKIARYAGGIASVRPYQAGDEPACRALLDAWRTELREMGVKIGPYYRYTRACLAEHDTFATSQLVGQVVEVEGAVAAFSFGGGITTSHASIFITVSDRRHPGLAYFQRRSLIEGLSNYRYFNDFNDSNRTGLRQMKRSFRPVQMHSLFVARRG